MNIKKFLFTAAAAAALAACSDYDPGLSEEAVNLTEAEEQLINEYTANFIDRYGQIDENHTWGFGEMGSVDEQGTRSANTNSNQWIDVVRNQETGDVTFDTHGRIVPGFPIVNQLSAHQGKYYVRFTQAGEGDYYTYDELVEKVKTDNITVVYPQGDVDAWNDLTTAEVSEVKAIFDENMGENFVSTSLLDLETFWVQQIFDGQESYVDAFGQKVNLNAEKHMDWLCAYPYSYYDWAAGQRVNVDGPDHINNFNASTGYIMLMVESGTQKFGFASSSNSGIVYLDNFRMVEYKGNYYVGFDFEADGYNGNEQIGRDYVFNDWIVKITPGEGGGTPIPNDEHWRIMCEDLGNTYDFDFNDLVYDVYYTGTEGNYTANITLQAAGGTLPIYIGQKDDDAYEVHRLFGFEPQANGSYLPVNVGTGKTADPVDITITGLPNTNPDNISIYVTTKTGGTTALNGNAITLLPPVGKSTSNAPQKICIHDTTVKWTKESQQIEYAYPHFDAWVQAQDGEYKIDGTTPWYKIDVDKDGKYLFSK